MCDKNGCNNYQEQDEYWTNDCDGENPRSLCTTHYVAHAKEHAACVKCFGRNQNHNVFKERMKAKENSPVRGTQRTAFHE